MHSLWYLYQTSRMLSLMGLVIISAGSGVGCSLKLNRLRPCAQSYGGGRWSSTRVAHAFAFDVGLYLLGGVGLVMADVVLASVHGDAHLGPLPPTGGCRA